MFNNNLEGDILEIISFSKLYDVFISIHSSGLNIIEIGYKKNNHFLNMDLKDKYFFVINNFNNENIALKLRKIRNIKYRSKTKNSNDKLNNEKYLEEKTNNFSLYECLSLFLWNTKNKKSDIEHILNNYISKNWNKLKNILIKDIKINLEILNDYEKNISIKKIENFEISLKSFCKIYNVCVKIFSLNNEVRYTYYKHEKKIIT